MNHIKKNETIILDTIQIKHLKFKKMGLIYSVSLIDGTGYEVVRGYDDSEVDAINDMHSNLL